MQLPFFTQHLLKHQVKNQALTASRLSNWQLAEYSDIYVYKKWAL